MERKINSRLLRWLGLLNCLRGAALYSKNTAQPLLFRSLTVELKATKINTALLYKLSKDKKNCRIWF